VRVPAPCYQVLTLLAEVFPALRPAERRGLVLWVVGAILSGSACQSAVVGALAPLGLREGALRQRLREWTYAGPERDAPCATTLDVTTCFTPLLAWMVRLWRGATLPLAIDMTTLADQWVVVVICVLYRGTAIPVAWQVRPGPGHGPWMPTACALLRQLAPAVPPDVRVLVLSDRGLWSPQLWRQILALGWHPVMRIRPDATLAPQGRPRRPAKTLVPGPDHAWVGAGTAFKHAGVRRQSTLVVLWAAGQTEPWLVLTDLAPEQIGPAWYGLRVWIEQGFRALKSAGWHWERCRRSDPDRVARHWLVIAVAGVLTAAYGTRVEDAQGVGIAPTHLHAPPAGPLARVILRVRHLLATGRDWLRVMLLTRRWWRHLWLQPSPLPTPSPHLILHVHVPELLP